MSILSNMVRFSEGRSNLGKVTNRTLSIEKFAKRFENPTRTRETIAAYGKLKLAEKQALKMAEGFFFAAPTVDGKRRKDAVLDRDMITIDIDENGEEVLASIRDGSNWVCNYCFVLHSTRSHTVEHPKFRIIVFSSTQIEPADHAKVSRIVSSKIDPTMLSIDPVSHRLAQMMYKPSCSKDSEYLYIFNTTDAIGLDEAELMSPKKVIEEFAATVGDPDDFSLLPKNPEKEDGLRNTLAKAEDPTAKEGPVGIWCRAYSIEEVIEKHLSDYYVPADHTGTDTRYTAVGAQGSAGCVVYDDGKFMTSNHTSDPCAGETVNAWDIVRLCLFGDEDENAREGIKITSMPSYKSMLKFAQNDAGYKGQLLSERYSPEDMLGDDMADGGDFDDDLDLGEEDESPDVDKDDFSDLIGDFDDEEDEAPVEGEIPEVVRLRRIKDTLPTDPDWFHKLEANKEGDLLPSLANVIRILTFDARFRGKLGHNELEMETYLKGDLIDKRNPIIPRIRLSPSEKASGGMAMSDAHDAVIRAIIAERNGDGFTGYGIDPADRTLRDAVVNVAMKRKFHPILDRIDKLEWDGVPRLGTFLHNFFGTPDDAYHAESFTMLMTALVGRQYEPGLKFDQMLILQGAQGARKSSVIQTLAFDDYAQELTCDLSDSQKVAEQTRGALICEIPELDNFRRTEAEAAKAFMSRGKEKVRMAYARKAVDVLRQFVVIGTTNESEYLRDATGNRRYWPVHVKTPLIDTDAIKAIRDQLYAEAKHHYFQMRLAKPVGHLWLDLQSKEAKEIHQRATTKASTETPEEELAAQIEEWLRTPVPVSEILGPEEALDHPDADKLALRLRTCSLEIQQELFTRPNAADKLLVKRALKHVPSLTYHSDKRVYFRKGIGRHRPHCVGEIGETHEYRIVAGEAPSTGIADDDLI